MKVPSNKLHATIEKIGGDNVQIIIYTTTTCPYCKMLEDYLKQAGKTYEKKLVDMDDAAKEEMIKESNGFLGVPFTVITKDDGTKENVIGFDKGKFNSILGLQA